MWLKLWVAQKCETPKNPGDYGHVAAQLLYLRFHFPDLQKSILIFAGNEEPEHRLASGLCPAERNLK
jgi:hypothetical protein